MLKLLTHSASISWTWINLRTGAVYKATHAVTFCKLARREKKSRHWPLTRYVKLRVAHAPGIPGTFSPPTRVSDPDMHHGTCVTHVPWCMPGSLTISFGIGGGENVPGIPSACATRHCAYLVRGPWVSDSIHIKVGDIINHPCHDFDGFG